MEKYVFVKMLNILSFLPDFVVIWDGKFTLK